MTKQQLTAPTIRHPPQIPAELSPDFLSAYATSTREAAEQAMKSLDTATNWALTLSLGILASVLNSSLIKGSALIGSEHLLLLSIVAAGYPMLTHFGIRAAKCYINIVRFAKLEREALKCNLLLEDGSPEVFKAALTTYHLNWKSPIRPWRIFMKVLLEFGFAYLFAIISFSFYFVSRGLKDDSNLPLIGALTLIPVLVELGIFSHSPYIKDPEPDHHSGKLS